jgi:hypothetical protein
MHPSNHTGHRPSRLIRLKSNRLRGIGKGGKLRYRALHPVAAERIQAYLEPSGHSQA